VLPPNWGQIVRDQSASWGLQAVHKYISQVMIVLDEVKRREVSLAQLAIDPASSAIGRTRSTEGSTFQPKDLRRNNVLSLRCVAGEQGVVPVAVEVVSDQG
jgi:hypothetical protein